jgi:hypothetical protein
VEYGIAIPRGKGKGDAVSFGKTEMQATFAEEDK